ncbi:MAG: hypothetical protein JXQ65_12195 [Candidatus Marinimicrobia bacterium]|nr:hypothetical protein [Candidatus Neomarinimicrobiota bacterium]
MKNNLILLLVFFFLIHVHLSGKTIYSKVENSNTLVVLIHGLADKPFSMLRLQNKMIKHRYSVLNFDYKSTKWPMDSIVTELDQNLRSLDEDIDSIYFVVHSLGTFVVRSYLAEVKNSKVKQIVMIAPPNKGSILAENFGDHKLFLWSLGESGQKLGKGQDDFWKSYPSPNIPFGIIAGGTNYREGFNPAIPGDDDGIVGVNETVIRGYTDIIKVPGLHSMLPWQDNVIDQTLYFLKYQRFQH